ncbi:MAG: uroporphyrinogen-III synthase [Pseudomonadota bacterium]
MRVIVTRPIQEAAQWVHALADAGFDAVALPLIGVLPPPDPAAVVAAWERLGDFDAVMFVSGNAVDHFFALKPSAAPVFGMPGATKIRAFVTGPGSLSALKRAQVSPRCIDMPDKDAGQFDSEALWAVVAPQVQAGYRVLVVRGTGSSGSAEVVGGAGDNSSGIGRDWFADQVRAAGGSVEFVVSYQRRSPDMQEAERALVSQAASDGSVWLFSSSEAIGNLVKACPNQSWTQAKAVVTHSRIAQAARSAGFSVVCESRPTLAALMASIESMA